jgi:hypothetical protein
LALLAITAPLEMQLCKRRIKQSTKLIATDYKWIHVYVSPCGMPLAINIENLLTGRA